MNDMSWDSWTQNIIQQIYLIISSWFKNIDQNI